jgi:hypothetical protein
MVELNFENNTNKTINIWTELAAYMIEIPPNHIYKVLTEETDFSFEFRQDDDLVMFFNKEVGFKLLISEKGTDIWQTEIDLLDIGK